jgi:hypothetical protein
MLDSTASQKMKKKNSLYENLYSFDVQKSTVMIIMTARGLTTGFEQKQL